MAFDARVVVLEIPVMMSGQYSVHGASMVGNYP